MLPLMMVMIMATMMMMTVVLLVVLMPVMLMLVIIMTVIMKEDRKHEEEEKSENHDNNKAEQGQPNSGPQRKGKKKGHQLHICERREESTQIEVIYRTRKKMSSGQRNLIKLSLTRLRAEFQEIK